MALRPAVQALKDFGPLDYEPETDEREELFLSLFWEIEPLLPVFTGKEAQVLAQSLGPSEHDFYGTKFVVLDWLEKVPGWPENVLRMHLPHHTMWRAIVLQRAHRLSWRTEYRWRAGRIYVCEGLEVRLRINPLDLNTKKSTRLSTGAFPWIKTFPAGLLPASTYG